MIKYVLKKDYNVNIKVNCKRKILTKYVWMDIHIKRKKVENNSFYLFI